MDEGLKWASAMGVVSALGAVVIGIVVINHVLGNPAGSFDVLLVPPAAVAAAILGSILWWALIERPRCLTDKRAILVGLLLGLLAHPLTWTLYILGGPLFLPSDWSDPAIMVKFTLLYSIFSVLFSGILTITGGVLSGLIVMRGRQYVHRDSTQNSGN